jgi:hypothetical protein
MDEIEAASITLTPCTGECLVDAAATNTSYYDSTADTYRVDFAPLDSPNGHVFHYLVRRVMSRMCNVPTRRQVDVATNATSTVCVIVCCTALMRNVPVGTHRVYVRAVTQLGDIKWTRALADIVVDASAILQPRGR